MKKISSGYTTFLKRMVPVFIAGFLVLFVTTGWRDAGGGDARWLFVVAVCFAAVMAFVSIKKALWSLVDEVQDGGDFLLVRKGSEEERILLSNVMNVSASTNNPPRIALRLVKPGRFGNEIAFIAPGQRTFNPFAKHPVVEDLIVRAYEARTRAISR